MNDLQETLENLERSKAALISFKRKPENDFSSGSNSAFDKAIRFYELDIIAVRARILSSGLILSN